MTGAPHPSTYTPTQAIRTPGSVLAAAVALHALTASAPYGLPALLPFIRHDLGGSYFEAGLVSSAFLFGIVVGSPLAGGSVDRFGVRRGIVGGLLVATIALAFVAGTASILVVCLLLGLAGIGYAVITPGTNKAMLAWFPPQRLATAVGIKQTGVSAGGIAAASFIPVISAAWGWRASFHVIAAFYAVALVLAAVTALDGASSALRRSARQTLREAITTLITDRGIVLLSIDGFLRVGIQYAFLTYLIAYAIDNLHAPVAWGIAIYVLAHIFGAIGRIGWGWTSDRLFSGRRRGTYIAIALNAAVGFVLLAYAAPLHTAILIASVALLGMSAAGFQGVGLSFLAESGGARAGAASGMVNALSFFGAAVSVSACGRLLDAGVSFATLFIGLAMLSVLCAALVHAMPDTLPYKVAILE